jgi:hypothetical protein
MGLQLPERKSLRELVSDERSAEDDGDLGLGDPLDHRFGLVEILEVEEVRRVVGAGHSQRVWTAAGRDEELVELQLSTRVERDGLFLEIDLRHLRLKADVDAVPLVPLHVAHLHALLEEHAPEIAGERHAVVERVLLVVDQDDLSRRVVLAQLLGRIRPGRAVADEHKTRDVRTQSTHSFCRVRLVSPNAPPFAGMGQSAGSPATAIAGVVCAPRSIGLNHSQKKTAEAAYVAAITRNGVT